MKPLGFVRWATLLSLITVCWGGGVVTADESAPSAADEPFSYALRPGESLATLERIFHVPAGELARRNGIDDLTRLQVGQVIQIPNVFARETAALRAERERLRQEKARAEEKLAAHDATVDGLEARLSSLESEKANLEATLGSMEDWRHRSLLLSAFLGLALVWGLKGRFDRARLAWKHRAVAARNAALSEANATYRRVAAQLELRYQRLYGGNQESRKEFVEDGIERIRRAYKDGSNEIERLLVRFQVPSERRPLAVRARSVVSRLFHPIRELAERDVEVEDHAS